jgi:glutamate-1-semialdehyde aminotransferase
METYEHLHALMRRRGVEYELDGKEPWFVCEALSDQDVDETLSALEDALKELKGA